MNDLTIVFYTANVISDYFAENIRNNLLEVAPEIPIVCVSREPMSFGRNIVVEESPSHFNIYFQALLGASEARTKYIALCEDDVLYSPEHFKHRPNPGKFAYNLGSWNLFTWGDPVLSHKGGGRINLSGLICERALFEEAMLERFAKVDVDTVDPGVWAEPGKYEKQLGVTVRDKELFYTNPPNIIFSHQKALGYANLGERKRLGEMRALRVPYWGTAEELRRVYQ